jgi:glutamate formiminotransferase/formiminotetrahydrofolate cyclodeaminase
MPRRGISVLRNARIIRVHSNIFVMPLLECVPNFSEGRDAAGIDAIAAAIRSVDGCALLHVDVSPAANRTVMTFAGEPNAVVEAAFQGIAQAAQSTDMTRQDGVHPRIGATDVCPLIPLDGLSMDEAVRWSQVLGRRVGDGLGIPVYLYEHSAAAAHRRALPDIRKGQYEGFAQKMLQPEWAPDFGPAAFTPASGATVMGARDILVAFNISLESTDLALATRIASKLRASGYIEQAGAERRRVQGRLPLTRAIGWHMADYNQAQVSINLLDFRVTSPLAAWEVCRELAAAEGVALAGSEVIGLVPEECLLEAGSFALAQAGKPTDAAPAILVNEAIRYMGLDRLKPFPPREKVLEYALQEYGLL